MSPAWKTLGILLLIGGLLGGAGCGHYQYDQFPAPSWNPVGLATPRIVDKDRIFVQPGPVSLQRSRAGVLIFRTSPEFPEGGPAIAEIFYREMLANPPFAELVFLPEIFTTKEDAQALAKHHYLDLVVLGEIPYYLDGGTVGNSGLQVDLKVMDAKDGRIVWSMSDSIRAVRRPIIDLWVTETRPYPTPSMGALAGRLAARMTATMKEGASPPPSGLAGFFPIFNQN
ncbi:MAG: hypothetical protein ACOC6K_00610 [Thermodesulfobacteriota bacterium]